MLDGPAIWLMVIGMVMSAGVFLLDMRRWRSPDSLVGRKQRGLRIALLVLIEATLGMWIVGSFLVNRNDILTIFVYWIVCLLLTLAMLILVVLDMREASKEYVRLSRKIARELREDSERGK